MTSMFVKYLGMQNSGIGLSEARGQGAMAPQILQIYKRKQNWNRQSISSDPPRFFKLPPPLSGWCLCGPADLIALTKQQNEKTKTIFDRDLRFTRGPRSSSLSCFCSQKLVKFCQRIWVNQLPCWHGEGGIKNLIKLPAFQYIYSPKWFRTSLNIFHDLWVDLAKIMFSWSLWFFYHLAIMEHIHFSLDFDGYKFALKSLQIHISVVFSYF